MKFARLTQSRIRAILEDKQVVLGSGESENG